MRLGTSISVGYMGENYADLGFPGMLGGILLLGLILALACRYFMTRQLPWLVSEGLVMGAHLHGRPRRRGTVPAEVPRRRRDVLPRLCARGAIHISGGRSPSSRNAARRRDHEILVLGVTTPLTGFKAHERRSPAQSLLRRTRSRSMAALRSLCQAPYSTAGAWTSPARRCPSAPFLNPPSRSRPARERLIVSTTIGTSRRIRRSLPVSSASRTSLRRSRRARRSYSGHRSIVIPATTPGCLTSASSDRCWCPANGCNACSARSGRASSRCFPVGIDYGTVGP